MLSMIAVAGAMGCLPVADAAAKDGESDSGSDSRSSDDHSGKDQSDDRSRRDDDGSGERGRGRERDEVGGSDEAGRDGSGSRRPDGRRLSTDEVFWGVQSGDFVPLADVMTTVRRTGDGKPAAVDLYVAADGTAVYEIVVVGRSGRLSAVRVDARTNRLLDVRARR